MQYKTSLFTPKGEEIIYRTNENGEGLWIVPPPYTKPKQVVGTCQWQPSSQRAHRKMVLRYAYTELLFEELYRLKGVRDG
jgi:hypothetical protein